MTPIRVAGGVVDVERRGGLWLYLEEPLELSERGQLLALAVLHLLSTIRVFGVLHEESGLECAA